MSDTPFTDANLWASIAGCVKGQHGQLVEQCYVPAVKVQELERKLNEAKERIRRLEEAGDLCLDFSFRGMHVIAEKQWREAKEAKP